MSDCVYFGQHCEKIISLNVFWHSNKIEIFYIFIILAAVFTLLLLLNSSVLSEGTFLHVRHFSCVHVALLLATINSCCGRDQGSSLHLSLPQHGEWAWRRKLRSCLPSLCTWRAPVFALQGVPQLEELTMCPWVGGWRGMAGRNQMNIQGGDGPVKLRVCGAVVKGWLHVMSPFTCSLYTSFTALHSSWLL